MKNCSRAGDRQDIRDNDHALRPDINRFPRYQTIHIVLCVSSKKVSNGKKRRNKRTNGKYLAWAYVEAANFMVRYSEPARKWYQRKASKTNKIVAIKALSNKIARACYFIIKDQKPFDPKKLFQ
ncbi:MAG: hypothetical protein HS132_12880 [Planctomycetia bacterium]|nr:hypothetical protein [Planctomycetia bacterium]